LFVTWSRFDIVGCLIEVIAGEGGADSALFSKQLWSAYLTYAAANRLCPELGEEGPSKWSFTLRGKAAFELFEPERGGHCIQRVPHTERSGRRHTSFVAVVVTPLRPEKTVRMEERDLEESFQRVSGPGGQAQNKISSGVRLHHKPTGLEVLIKGRDQSINRQTARECLRGKLAAHEKERAQAGRATYGGAGRGDKIRTYNLIVDRIVDHRNGAKCHRPQLVLDKGQFELLR